MMEFTVRLTRKRAAMLVVVALGICAGAAYAAIPDGNKVFTACMLKNVGTVRLIDTSLPASNPLGHCTSLEAPVTWNQQGQAGRDGINGTNGKDGSNGTNGKDGKDGSNGTNGTDGISVTSTPEPAGQNCTTGGTKLTAANGVSYVCNGIDGTNGKDGKDGSNAGPMDIIAHSYFTSPALTEVDIVQCPPGEVVLGGTFDKHNIPFLTLTSSQSGPNAWQYTSSYSPGGPGLPYPVDSLTFCGKS